MLCYAYYGKYTRKKRYPRWRKTTRIEKGTPYTPLKALLKGNGTNDSYVPRIRFACLLPWVGRCLPGTCTTCVIGSPFCGQEDEADLSFTSWEPAASCSFLFFSRVLALTHPQSRARGHTNRTHRSWSRAKNKNRSTTENLSKTKKKRGLSKRKTCRDKISPDKGRQGGRGVKVPSVVGGQEYIQQRTQNTRHFRD